MDKLRAMTTFVQIADAGSLTAAAGRLGTSLPTVVRTLAALENALGARLMTRTTRKVTLTDEGRHYLERCRVILSDVEDAERALSHTQGEPTGKLVITAPVMFGKLHVRPIVTAFMQQHAGISVELLLLDRTVNLVDEGIDVAVRIGHLGDSAMVARQVGEIRQVICASPSLIDSVGAPQQPADLETRNCVRMTGLAPGPSFRLWSNGRAQSVRVHDVLVCNQADAAIDACVDGIGFGLFLSYQVDALMRDGKLVRCLADHEPPPLPVNVVYLRPRLMSTRVRAFVERATRDLRNVLEQGGHGMVDPG